MTNPPNRDDREASSTAAAEKGIKPTKIYYGGPSRGKSAQKVVSIAAAAAAAENFHHQDWPSLRDNDRHHVVAPPSTQSLQSLTAHTYIHTRSSLVARFSKETFVCVQSCYFALPVCRCAQAAAYPA